MSVLFVAAAAFGIWAFGQRQDYKNNVDQKIVAANQVAVKAEDAKKDAEFAEASKNPLKTYNGPSDFGSISLQYPKTWSAYVDEQGGTATVTGYFYPNVVPSLTASTSVFALRLQVVNQQYSSVLQPYSNFIKLGQATATPYKLPKLSSVVGTRIDGKIANNKTGSVVILPLRDKTIEIWTESNQFLNDFNTYILPNFTFSP